MAQLGAAHAAVGAALQQAKQLDLHGQRNVAHLVNEQRAAAGRFHQARLGGGGASEGAAFMAKQRRLKQIFWQAGAVHRHQRALRPVAGLVHRTGHQFLASARLAQQQHRGAGRRHAGDQRQHLLKGRSTANQLLRDRRLHGGAQQRHLFDKKSLFALGIAERRQLDVHVLLALWRVVQVQHALTLARLPGAGQRAGFTCLVTGLVKVVRHLVAGAAQHAAFGAELPLVGRIGCQDAVLRIEQDVRLGHALKK